ncbi:MAG TPA: hypothetical protein VE967_17405 [Gemmatimonadaceae bacterium]|nr:hypothetical protein [Gemmatimonadaceae bacterium]
MRSTSVVLALLLAGPLLAQKPATPPVSPPEESHLTAFLELGGANSMFFGDLKRIHSGYGVDVAAVLSPQYPLLLAFGVNYTRHSTDSTTEKLGLTQTYIEPRFMLKRSGRLIPIVAARLAFARWHQTITLIDDTGVNVTGEAVATGPSLGASATLLYKSSPHVRTYLTVTGQSSHFGDLDLDGARVSGSAETGITALVRAGISIDFSLEPAPFRAHPGR